MATAHRGPRVGLVAPLTASLAVSVAALAPGDPAVAHDAGPPAQLGDVNTTAQGFLSVGDIAAVGEDVYFIAETAARGRELHFHDRSAGTTLLVYDVRPGPADGAVGQLTAVGDVVFFVGSDGVNGEELWHLRRRPPAARRHRPRARRRHHRPPDRAGPAARPTARRAGGRRPRRPAPPGGGRHDRDPDPGRGGVPTGASAAFLNVAAVLPDGPGFVTLSPCGPLPHTSNLNFASAGVLPANNAFTKLSDDGTVCAYTLVGTDLVVDTTGWVG